MQRAIRPASAIPCSPTWLPSPTGIAPRTAGRRGGSCGGTPSGRTPWPEASSRGAARETTQRGADHRAMPSTKTPCASIPTRVARHAAATPTSTGCGARPVHTAERRLLAAGVGEPLPGRARGIPRGYRRDGVDRFRDDQCATPAQQRVSDWRLARRKQRRRSHVTMRVRDACDPGAPLRRLRPRVAMTRPPAMTVPYAMRRAHPPGWGCLHLLTEPVVVRAKRRRKVRVGDVREQRRQLLHHETHARGDATPSRSRASPTMSAWSSVPIPMRAPRRSCTTSKASRRVCFVRKSPTW